MRKSTATYVPTIPMFFAALLLASTSIAADSFRNPTQTPSGAAITGNLEVLDEVLVEGRRPETDTRKLQDWMERLVGEFRYEGNVERLGANGAEMDRAQVSGGSRCVQFGSAAAVQCQINATWPEIRGEDGVPAPGGVSSLTPAVAIYSLELRAKYVGHFSVDNDGVATVANGWLLGDTLVARSPCVELPGKCERVLRLEALPDARVIRMRVDLERDGKPEVRYNFQWIRLEQQPQAYIAAEGAPEPVSAPPVGGRANAAVSPEVDSWLRRLVGQYRVTKPRECRGVRGGDVTAGCTERSADMALATRSGPVDAQCQGVGTGPGVRCIIYMEWPESGIPPERWSPHRTPFLMLYGFDPVERGIAELRVLPTIDTIGASYHSVGQLRDGDLTFCSNQACTIRSHMLIAPSGEWIRFVGVGLRIGNPSVQDVLAWRMYRVKEGISIEAENPRRTRRNLSPRR